MQLVVSVVTPGWAKAYSKYMYVATANCIMVSRVPCSLLQVYLIGVVSYVTLFKLVVWL